MQFRSWNPKQKNFVMDGLRNSLVVQMVKNLTAMQENGVWLIPGSETCPGGGNGYPLQYSCLENWEATVCEVPKRWTQLSD